MTIVLNFSGHVPFAAALAARHQYLPSHCPPLCPSPQSTRALGSISWNYDNRVDVAVSNSRLLVTVNGRIQRPGPVVALAAQTKCHLRPDRCYGGGRCDSRRVDIIRPGIAIAITQPFIREGRKGHYADWLEV